MKAMVLKQLGRMVDNPSPLELVDLPVPIPDRGDILVKVSVCGVCHTELDEIEGRTPPAHLPVVLGHQVIGTVQERGETARTFRIGERVGVAWIFSACGECDHCRTGQENLCRQFRATGRDADGGYADYLCVRDAFAYSIPETLSDAEAAPLLCAGAIGYRSLKLAGLQDGQILGLVGFGASNHIVLKLARYLYPSSPIYVFSIGEQERVFARQLGAAWAGDIGQAPPEPPQRIIDTTPVWKPIVEALAVLAPGGRLVINAIRKEGVDKDQLSRLEYPTHLWLEKEVKSVANITRLDVQEFLELATRAHIQPEVQEYPLEDANQALRELKEGKIRGAKVLRIAPH